MLKTEIESEIRWEEREKEGRQEKRWVLIKSKMHRGALQWETILAPNESFSAWTQLICWVL